ncbi:hypothetical protein [Actinoplanes sp. DH11]|uniref:hypothetical protein n=1 Tax=Actinoplanes sp. DH11 TaxID=2857011 RepID=UPI001E5D58E9|nr:hypothetical protein [Actinoplanes sp. DH11]
MPTATRIPLSQPALVHPLWFLVFAAVLSTVPAALSTEGQRGDWGQDWVLSNGDLWLQAAGIGFLVLGVAISGRTAATPWLTVSDGSLDRLEKLTRILFWLAMAGYLVWFGLAVLQNGPSFLTGGSGAQKAVTVPGITTLTQVGPFVIAACTLLHRLGRPHPVMLVLTLVLGAIRVVANSERLALLELLMPLAVVLALLPRVRGARVPGPKKRWPSGLAFLGWSGAGLGALLGFFALSEQSRSWSFYASRTDQTLLGFSADRLQAYYATATNNGALYLHGLSPDLIRPETTLQFLWEFPVLGGAFRAMSGGDRTSGTDLWRAYLDAHSNPEFNNPSALLPIFGELRLLAPVLLVLVGVVLGRVYRNACAGSPAALLGYAVAAIGLLELPRFFYYGQGRAFPLVVVCLLAAMYLRAPRRSAAEAPTQQTSTLHTGERHVTR